MPTTLERRISLLTRSRGLVEETIQLQAAQAVLKLGSGFHYADRKDTDFEERRHPRQFTPDLTLSLEASSDPFRLSLQSATRAWASSRVSTVGFAAAAEAVTASLYVRILFTGA